MISFMNETNDFDRLIKNFTSQDGSAPQQRKAGLVKTPISALLAAATVSCFGGLIVMWANRVVIDAYPNLHGLAPGIGYFNASRLFFCTMLVYFIFSALQANKEK
jgi:hypothetical protein